MLAIFDYVIKDIFKEARVRIFIGIRIIFLDLLVLSGMKLKRGLIVFPFHGTDSSQLGQPIAVDNLKQRSEWISFDNFAFPLLWKHCSNNSCDFWLIIAVNDLFKVMDCDRW